MNSSAYSMFLPGLFSQYLKVSLGSPQALIRFPQKCPKVSLGSPQSLPWPSQEVIFTEKIYNLVEWFLSIRVRYFNFWL